jgi:hypothetical protein
MFNQIRLKFMIQTINKDFIDNFPRLFVLRVEVFFLMERVLIFLSRINELIGIKDCNLRFEFSLSGDFFSE